jgi:hypothetical protein
LLLGVPPVASRPERVINEKREMQDTKCKWMEAISQWPRCFWEAARVLADSGGIRYGEEYENSAALDEVDGPA